MARPLHEIVRLDRRWFRAHAERKHRCRWPDMGELEFCGNDRGGPLIITIRHIGRGRLVYQPVIFEGMLPKDERSAAVLFALAARHPAPIPKVAAMDVCLLARRQAGHAAIRDPSPSPWSTRDPWADRSYLANLRASGRRWA